MEYRKKVLSFGLICLLTISLASCGGDQSAKKTESSSKDSTVKVAETPKFDIEIKGDEVRIGKQTWMRKNLDVKKFRNGDPIFEKKSNPDWERLCEASQPIYGYIMNNPQMEQKYGLIYNWYAVNDPRGLAPEGWRISTEKDWLELIEYLGGDRIAGLYLKDTQGWSVNGNGNNVSGFAALPGGFMGYYGESYQEGFSGGWWTNTEISKYFATGFSIVFDDNSVKKSNGYKFDGFSVRCIKE